MNEQSTSTSNQQQSITLSFEISLMNRKTTVVLTGTDIPMLFAQATNIMMQHPDGMPKERQITTSEGTFETWRSQRVEVSNEKGQKRLRVFGGKWEKYGVPMYPDCPEDEGGLLKLEYGVHEGNIYDITIELVGGKPRRVVKTALVF